VTRIIDLFKMLEEFHRDYVANIFPNLQDSFTLELFNSYRSALYPGAFPRPLRLNSDSRGTLFEIAKGGGGGQFFSSWTKPGFTRGNHFHLGKVERFVVVSGEAVIRMRRVLGGPVLEYRLTGDAPAAVDIPTLYTHSIENVGQQPLLTLFWTHDIFDLATPDTFQDSVQKA
jgi:UDP-2-acetamido-2,6-beta-L-arabino-hexul-4-ose reductase